MNHRPDGTEDHSAEVSPRPSNRRVPALPNLFRFAPVALLFGALASGSALPAAELPSDCMPVSEVRVGMKGQAFSVYEGFELSTYEIEVIGIEHGALTGSAMILARVEGPGLEDHGIVAGMSGSPVYIDGRVVGAIAWGWSFSYHPLAGITPIEHMLTLWDDLEAVPAEGRARRRAGGAGGGGGSAVPASAGWDWRSDWDRYRSRLEVSEPARPLVFRPESPGVRDLIGDQPLELRPLSAPVFVTGASAANITRLKNYFSSRGLDVMEAHSSAGSGVPSAGEPSPPFRNGSAVGVPFVVGDMSIASMGTVTYVRGDSLLAFGHPMFFEGSVEAPMSHAYVFQYMQSYNRSFKLSEMREIVGTIWQDRQFAIGGRVGRQPERIDVHVKTGGDGAAWPREFDYSVWEDEDMLPLMASISMEESYLASVSGSGEVTADLHYTIRMAEGEPIRKSLRTASRSGASFEFFFMMLQDLFLLTGNPFEPVDLVGIDIELDVRDGYNHEELVRAEPRYLEHEPGDTVELDTVWRPFRGPERESRISLDLPGDLDPGGYVIHIADASTASRIDQRREAGRFDPRNKAETVDLVRRFYYPRNRLRVYLLRPDVALGLRGDSFAGAPASVAGVMTASAPERMQSLVIGEPVIVRDIELEYPVAGSASILIEVSSRVSR